MEKIASIPLTFKYLFFLFLPWFFITSILFLIRRIPFFKEKITISELSILFLTGVTFLTTGFTIGLLSSLSRTSASEAMIPAALTFISGFFAYMIKKDEVFFSKITSFVSVLAFCMSLLYGAEIGSHHRNEYEKQQKEEEQWYKKELEEFKNSLRQPE